MIQALTLTQMRYLLTLEQTRHFAKAAHALGVTQPTLSQTDRSNPHSVCGATVPHRPRVPSCPTCRRRRLRRMPPHAHQPASATLKLCVFCVSGRSDHGCQRRNTTCCKVHVRCRLKRTEGAPHAMAGGSNIVLQCLPMSPAERTVHPRFSHRFRPPPCGSYWASATVPVDIKGKTYGNS